MGLKKGQTNNRKGRPAGVPNKTTQQLRQQLRQFVDMNIDRLQKDFDTLEPKERLMFFEKIVKYCLPPPVPEIEMLTDEQINGLLEDFNFKRICKIEKN